MTKKRATAADHAALAVRSAATARKAGEAMNAAAAVIAARTEMCSSPTIEAGLEMNLMVTEKMAAFAEAGSALAEGATHAVQKGAAYAAGEAAAAGHGAAAIAACRSPLELMSLQARLMSEFVTRGMAYGLSLNTVATRTGEKVVDPLHKTVSANARRLKK